MCNYSILTTEGLNYFHIYSDWEDYFAEKERKALYSNNTPKHKKSVYLDHLTNEMLRRCIFFLFTFRSPLTAKFSSHMSHFFHQLHHNNTVRFLTIVIIIVTVIIVNAFMSHLLFYYFRGL